MRTVSAGSGLVWREVLHPTGLFLAVALVSVLVGMANAWRGGPHLAPGERLWPVSTVLAVFYIAALWVGARWRVPRLAGAPGQDRSCAADEPRPGWRAQAFSAVAGPLVLAVLLVPALNGVAGRSAETRVVMQLRELTSHTARAPRPLFWMARLEPVAPAESVALQSLPAGVYFVGRQGVAWHPEGRLPQPGSRFEVRHRIGLLGARVVTSAMPLEASEPPQASASPAEYATAGRTPAAAQAPGARTP